MCNFICKAFEKTRSAVMKISYKKLWVMLIQRDITKVQLRTDVGISAGTMSKLNKGEDVALSVLLRICDYLNCDIGDICEAVRMSKND
jgi:putative transcriptional regulator